jgi:hypothetical protein
MPTEQALYDAEHQQHGSTNSCVYLGSRYRQCNNSSSCDGELEWLAKQSAIEDQPQALEGNDNSLTSRCTFT